MTSATKNINKKVGNEFETFFCTLLFSYGFWAHNAAQNQAGQPADIIAARNGTPYLIDCKVCDNDVFPFDHIEDNQESAMTLWEQKGNGFGYFALKLSDQSIYMFTLRELQNFRKRQTRLNKSEIRLYGMPFKEWESKCK